ncbi:MAG: hypothetical protein ACE5FW_03005, partial [Candidatus Aenigmatarchaeota archaeon]
PAPPAAPGGVGGGGGVAPTPPCQEDWTCTSWGSCVDGTQTRVCTDQNSCGTAINKSDQSRSCVIAMTLDLPATYVNADQCVTQCLTIKNTGTADIRNLAAPSDVTITDCCTITSTQRISKLGAGRRETISIRVCAPKDAAKDSYSTTLEITSNEINKSVTAHIHVTKEYAEVLADRADQLGSDLAQIDPAQLDITQAGWYAEAQRAVEKAKEYAAEGNFNAAEAALQLASANLAKIAAYVLPPLDIWWLLPVLPIVIVAGGLGVWWSRRRPPKYAYKPVRGYPIRYDKSALLKEVEGLHKKVQGIKRDKLGLTDKYYYDKAKGALDSVKQHILGDNLVAAKRTLTEAETYLRVLESRLLSFNLLKTVKG